MPHKFLQVTHPTLIVILVVLLCGCTEEIIKEVPVEVELQKSWKEKSQFEGLTKIKTNSYSTDKYLFLYGPNFFSRMDSKNIVRHYFTLLPYPEYYRLPISESYFIQVENEWLRFVSSENPVTDQFATWINFKGLDPDFEKINYGPGYLDAGIDINSNGQCLVPISTTNPNKELVAYMFSTFVEQGYIRITDTVRLTIPDYASGWHTSVKAIKDYFIVSTSSGIYKVYPDGQFRMVSDKTVSRVIQHRNTLYAFDGDITILRSKDDGETWKSYTNHLSLLQVSNYFTVSDSLIGTSWDDIFSIKFTEEGDNLQYKVRFLKNDGIETNTITSVSLFKDSIYAATYSGVYYKSKNSFFESKGEQK